MLVVYKIDRLARSLSDLLRLLERIATCGASFRSLTEPIETETPAGRLMLQMLGAFAEFERAVIRERCEAGRREARVRGVRFGRPPKLPPDEVEALLAEGLSYAAIARRYRVNPSCVSRLAAALRGDDGRSRSRVVSGQAP